MAVVNALACYDKGTITAVKSFIVQAPFPHFQDDNAGVLLVFVGPVI